MEERGNVIELNLGLTRVISLKIDEDTVRELDTICRRYNYRSRSELIREALSFYTELLKKYNREEAKRIIKKILNGEYIYRQ